MKRSVIGVLRGPRYWVPIVVFAGLLVAIVHIPITAADTGQVVATPTDDAHAESAAPNTSFGSSPVLATNGSSRNVKRTYLKFAVSGLPAGATITQVILTVSALNTTNQAAKLRPAAAGWAESSLTWKNRPAYAASTVVTSSPNRVVAGPISFDVSKLVKGNGGWSFGLFQGRAASADTTWSSREGAPPPQLTVSYSISATPTPTASPSTSPTPSPTPTGSLTPSPSTSPSPTPSPVAAGSKVMWIWEENRSQSQIIGNPDMPYVNQLAQTFGYAANMHNETNPSLGNYIAAMWGSTFGIADDLPPAKHPLVGPSIFDQLPVGDAMVFAESMPTVCQTTNGPAGDVNRQGFYTVRHTGWPYDTTSSAACQLFDRPFQGRDEGVTNDALAEQVAAGLPHFTSVIPATCNNMHRGGSPDVCRFDAVTGPNYYTRADWWLRANLQDVFSGPDWTAGNLVIFLTWDEGSGPGDTAGMDCITSTIEACHIPTIVMSPTTSHVVSNDNFNHYSMLRATEELLGLPLLANASLYPSMHPAFDLGGPDPGPTPTDTPSPSANLSPTPSGSPTPTP